MRGRSGQVVKPLGETIVPFGVEPVVHPRVAQHHVAAEGQPAVADLQKIGHPAGTVAAGFDAADLAAAPLEQVRLGNVAVQRDRLDRRTHVARAVNRVGIAQLRPHLAEATGLLEQCPLRLRRGHLGAEGLQPGVALALLAMVMREQHPIDPLHADLAQMVQDAAVAQVDQQGRLAVAEHVDVAGIAPDEHVGQRRVDRRQFARRSVDGSRRRSLCQSDVSRTEQQSEDQKASHGVSPICRADNPTESLPCAAYRRQAWIFYRGTARCARPCLPKLQSPSRGPGFQRSFL